MPAAILRAALRSGAGYRVTADGAGGVEVYHVTGATGTGLALLADALAAPGVPAYGDAHASLAGLVVLELDPRPLAGPGEVAVHVTYGPPLISDPVHAAVGDVIDRRWLGATVEKQVTADKDGAEMTLTYTGAFAGAFNLSSQTQEATIQAPTDVFEVDRVEAALPAANSRLWRGHVNSITWNGDSARTWLCIDVSGRAIRATANFLVSYRFAYEADGWTHKAKVKLAGLIPHDAVGNGGSAEFFVYQERDFNSLTGFTF